VGEDVLLYSFLTSVLDRVSVQHNTLAFLPPGKELITYWIGGRVGPKAESGRMRKHLAAGVRTASRPPVASDHAISAYTHTHTHNVLYTHISTYIHIYSHVWMHEYMHRLVCQTSEYVWHWFSACNKQAFIFRYLPCVCVVERWSRCFVDSVGLEGGGVGEVCVEVRPTHYLRVHLELVTEMEIITRRPVSPLPYVETATHLHNTASSLAWRRISISLLRSWHSSTGQKLCLLKRGRKVTMSVVPLSTGTLTISLSALFGWWHPVVPHSHAVL